MQVLNVEEMESFFNTNLKDVMWWMSIKDAYKLGASIIIRLSQERCISLVTKGRSSRVAHKHD
jgi:hypothetical protein